VITLKTNRVEKEESLNKFSPQIEDLLKSTSEDEPDIKDNTSQDVNGHVPGVFMPANPVSQPIYGDFSSDLAVLNGFCNLSQNEDEKGDCEIIRLADQRQQDDISKMAEEAEQKIKSEIQMLYDHREARLNKIAEEEKQRKFIGHMNSSAHMKLAIDRCVPKKRKYADVMMSPYYGLFETLNVPSMEQLANQKNVLNPLMIEKCKSDLKCPFNRIDRIFLSHDLEKWLSRSIVGRCKFPWCNDISVDRSFWHGLWGVDDHRKGWLVNFEKSNATHDKEFRLWYLKMRQCLEEKIHVVLKETGVFEKKNIDPAKYKISITHADHVHKQGIYSYSLYMLAYGVPLAVDDSVQAALAYREKMIHFYFQHKMFCP
ncbi:hypothetical protein Tco_0497551, partial [Tanacetum coccineum]